MIFSAKLIKIKMNLLDLTFYSQNVREACWVVGYSPDTFFRVNTFYQRYYFGM